MNRTQEKVVGMSCSIVITSEMTKITHHFHSTEDMTEMVATLQILGNISKCTEVIWVLSGARNVPDLVLSHNCLVERGRKMRTEKDMHTI